MASLEIRPGHVAVIALATVLCLMWSTREVVTDTEALPEHQWGQREAVTDTGALPAHGRGPRKTAHHNSGGARPPGAPTNGDETAGGHDASVEKPGIPAAQEPSPDLWAGAEPASFEFAPADTDLPQDEVAQAIRDFDAERTMWLRLASLDATIRLQRAEDDAVEGRVQITREEASPGPRGLPWSFRLVITDKEGKWQFSTDGTRGGTTLRCDDGVQEKRLRQFLDKSVFWTILCPHFLLAEAYDDGLNKAAERHTAHDEFFRTVRPWRSRDSPDANSYSFFRGPVPANIITLEQGHIRSWRKGLLGSEPVRLTFAAPALSNGMWFPTSIEEVRDNVPVRTYRLNHVSIGLSPNNFDERR